jgi:hypothetical protein
MVCRMATGDSENWLSTQPWKRAACKCQQAAVVIMHSAKAKIANAETLV